VYGHTTENYGGLRGDYGHTTGRNAPGGHLPSDRTRRPGVINCVAAKPELDHLVAGESLCMGVETAG